MLATSVVTANLSEILVYGAIAIITLIGLVKCIYPVARNAKLLTNAVVKLEKDTNSDKPIWREARFLGRSLRAEWQQFLLNAGQLDLRGIPCDTRDYINEETVIEKPGHAQLADLIPSLLTSLGILGTFLGLMQGLTSVNFSNAEGTMQSIPQMLTGMRFAFATSVAGISCSLVFNVLNRIATGHALRSLDSFEDCFYELAMPRPLEPEVQMLCQKQDEDDMWVRMGDQIAARMAATMEAGMNNVLISMNRLCESASQTMSREQLEGVRRITNQFIQQMNVSLAGQLGSLSSAMRDNAESQNQTMQRLNTAMYEIQKATDHAMQLTQQNTEMILQLQSLCTQMDAQQTRRSQMLLSANDAGREMTESFEQLTQSMQNMKNAVDKAGEYVTELTQSRNGQDLL